ncbi:glycosyltransferase [Bacillus sp. V3B]|uniref:glycosyltransferase family 2 protein n=1 Tax=Bacillus sp. V3B TaxID=2804915 RepID=UPI00210AA499|nr:glycosyltransferase [Bacillus sp. V3B]MCQ6275290.1 glycosyltransferase [Bacillus sp. V3B]
MNIKVSIIIPVYNAEKYIIECIESLINQTLEECEFIFVNDGSKDRSSAIIDEFKKKDNRIILINQENQGVSIARNNGLKAASGEYVGFVDADDYIEKDMYEKLYNSARENNCDIVISNFESELEGHKVITKYLFPINISLQKDFIEQQVLPYFIMADNLNTAWNKIYRNKMIYDNKVKFPERFALGEDGIFNIKAFSYATRIKYIDYTGYHYREVKGSATRDILQKDYFKRALEVYSSELPRVFIDKIERKKIEKLKAIKLVNSVLAYIHIYFTPTKALAFRKRYRYVRNMISNNQVKEALIIYYSEKYHLLGRYEKVLINMMLKKSTMGLYYVTLYSRFRNK